MIFHLKLPLTHSATKGHGATSKNWQNPLLGIQCSPLHRWARATALVLPGVSSLCHSSARCVSVTDDRCHLLNWDYHVTDMVWIQTNYSFCRFYFEQLFQEHFHWIWQAIIDDLPIKASFFPPNRSKQDFPVPGVWQTGSDSVPIPPPGHGQVCSQMFPPSEAGTGAPSAPRLQGRCPAPVPATWSFRSCDPIVMPCNFSALLVKRPDNTRHPRLPHSGMDLSFSFIFRTTKQSPFLGYPGTQWLDPRLVMWNKKGSQYLLPKKKTFSAGQIPTYIQYILYTVYIYMLDRFHVG